MFKKIIKFFGILLSMLIISFFTFFYVRVKEADGNIKEATFGILEDVADQITNLEPVYVLILGISTDQSNALTDTLILAGYNPKTQNAFLISIPRDTFVGINIKRASTSDKINALYSTGIDKTINTVEDITNINIDYYVTIKTEMLIKIVDTLGGVEFDVPIDMKYTDKSQGLYINLKKGKQLLDGNKAEQLLRFRHNNDGTSYSSEYGNNDFGRMKTQRLFIKELLKQALQVNDISTLKEIIKVLFEDIDTNMELSKVFSYLVYAYEFNFDNLTLEGLPGKSVYKNNLWLFEYDKTKSKELINQIMTKFDN